MVKTAATRPQGPAPWEVAYPSKVALPGRRPNIVRRQRLIDLLTDGLQRRLTVVSAPAGYGKTTLLLDFALTCDLPVCWYALDERDRELDTFLRYFLACGRGRFPGFGVELTRALSEGQPISQERATDLMVAAVQAVGEPFLVILDDLHHLEGASSGLWGALEGWLYRLPGHCHVILSSRTRLPLSVLPLMSARQEVATVTGPDFAFSGQEAVRLFGEVLGKDISLEDGQRLAEVAEGWAAALILMADKIQAVRDARFLEQLRGSDTLFQYIKLEQFDPLPDDMKEFLLGSAVLRTADPTSVNELLQIADAEEKVNHLEQKNLFVVRQDGHPTHYRYHRLARAFLVSHLRAQAPQRFRKLHLRAAALRERARDWEETVYHYLQAGAWERIVEVTEKVGWQLFEEGKWDTLADWLQAIPAQALAAQPKLLLWKARILHHLNQLDQALALLAQAVGSFTVKQEWIPLAEALVIQGMCLRVKGDYEEAKGVLNKARSLLLQHDGPTSILTEARKELGITHGMCGEFERALGELKGALEVYEALGDVYNIASLSDSIGTALLCMGRLSEAAGYLEKARHRWVKLGNDRLLIRTLDNLGLLYLCQGDYDRSQAIYQESLDKAGALGSRALEVYPLVNLAEISRDSGRYAEALERYERALALGRELDQPYVSIYVLDGMANTCRLMGDMARAESLVKAATAEAEERGGVYELGLCTASLALMQRERGDLKEAAATLERAVGLLKESTAKRELATAYFHLAGTYFSLKRKRLALDCLEMVARLVSELGYDHFVRLEATRNPLLVQYAAANKLADGYFNKLLKLSKVAPKPAPVVTEAPVDIPQTEPAGARILAYGFGNLRVEVDGRAITDLEWRSEKSKEMFFFFLCHRRPLRREEIVAALWPDLPEEKTSSAFHSTLYRLRQALYPDCIAKESGRYILDPQGQFLFDVAEFQQLLETVDRLPQGSPEIRAHLERAVEIYKGPFAPDFFSEWAETLRWQLEEQYTSRLAALAGAYSQAGEFKRSADLCQRILDVDEYNEAAWYRLMSNYIQSGQLEAAKYCYNRYVQIVSDGLDGEGLPDFDAIQRQVKMGVAPH